MSREHEIADLLSTIRDMDDYRTASGYYLGRAVSELLALLGDRKAVAEIVMSELKVKLNPSQISKYCAWGSLPDSPAAKKLSLTRGYEVGRKSLTGWEGAALRASDPTDPYTWSAFDADILGKLPPEEKPLCVCPTCGRLHTRQEEGTDAP